MNVLNLVNKIDGKKVMTIGSALLAGVGAVMTSLENDKKDALLKELVERVTELEKK